MSRDQSVGAEKHSENASGEPSERAPEIEEREQLQAQLESLHLTIERLTTQIDEYEERVAFLEEDLVPPRGSPSAPSWVRGRLLRGLTRAQHVFERLAEIDQEIERYQDALLVGRVVLEDLAHLSDAFGSADERLALLSTAEEALQELLDASVAIEVIRDLATSASRAEDELILALQQSEDSPLLLGTKLKRFPSA